MVIRNFLTDGDRQRPPRRPGALPRFQRGLDFGDLPTPEFFQEEVDRFTPPEPPEEPPEPPVVRRRGFEFGRPQVEREIISDIDLFQRDVQGERAWEDRRESLFDRAKNSPLGQQFWSIVGISPSANVKTLTEDQVSRLAGELEKVDSTNPEVFIPFYEKQWKKQWQVPAEWQNVPIGFESRTAQEVGFRGFYHLKEGITLTRIGIQPFTIAHEMAHDQWFSLTIAMKAQASRLLQKLNRDSADFKKAMQRSGNEDWASRPMEMHAVLYALSHGDPEKIPANLRVAYADLMPGIQPSERPTRQRITAPLATPETFREEVERFGGQLETESARQKRELNTAPLLETVRKFEGTTFLPGVKVPVDFLEDPVEWWEQFRAERGAGRDIQQQSQAIKRATAAEMPGIVGLVSSPLWGGGLSVSDIAVIGTFVYASTQAASIGWNFFLRSSVIRNLNSYAKSANIEIPKETQTNLVNQIMQNVSRRWLSQQAIRTIFRPSKTGFRASPEKAKEAAQDITNVVQREVPALISRGTQTGALAFGGLPADRGVTPAISSIVDKIISKTPLTPEEEQLRVNNSQVVEDALQARRQEVAVAPPVEVVPGVAPAITPEPPPAPPEPAVTAIEPVTEGVAPEVPPQVAQAVSEIQKQGNITPDLIPSQDAKYAHNELSTPDGPKPPPPPTPVIRSKDSDDLFREITSKGYDERVDQTLLRLHEAAINTLKRKTSITIQEGDRKLKALGIGVVKRGQLVPRERDIPQLTDLYNALHNPSKVTSGEITIPVGMEVIYNELRGLADWDTASRLDFDPEAATLEDWFFRGWKPPEGQFVTTEKGRLGIKPKALRAPRVDATFEEMMEAGFEPLFWNPYQQWGYRHKLGEIYREQIELVSYLKGMGNEMIRPDSGGALPVGWRVPRIGPAFEGKPFTAEDADKKPVVMFTRRWIVPTPVANMLENIYGRRPDMGTWVVAGKIVDPLKLIDLVTFVPKRAKLLFSLFQQVDFGTRAGGGSWAGMVDSLIAGKPLDAVKALAVYPQTVFSIIEANFSPTKRLSFLKQLDDTTSLVQGRPGVTLKGIGEAGLSTMDVTIFAEDMDKLMRSVADKTGIWDRAKGVADSFIDLESAMRRGLFNGVYPAAMITDIKNNLAVMVTRQHSTLTDQQINGIIAREVNKKYSTIPPSQSVFQNSVLREVLRRVFFSVGESEGLLRQAAGMFTGPSKRFWVKNNLGVLLFVLAVANVIHFASTGKPLPKERYVPISRNHWGPLPFGYNSEFASPTIPWKGRGGVELTVDLMGQMDTALRVLDPGSFLSARTSVPIRAAINQYSGTDFYGAPINDVGPGGIWSRSSQLAFDLFAPIGVGGILTEQLRGIEGIEDLVPRGESRLGQTGLAIQATGLNIRAEVTSALLDRHARESGLLKSDGTPVERWADLEPVQKDEVGRDPQLLEELARRSEASVERGAPGALGFLTLQELDALRIDRGEALVTEFDQGIHDPQTFRTEVTKLKLEITSRKSQVDDDFQLFSDTEEMPEDPNRRALVEYYEIYDSAQRLSGVIDWDKVERLESNLRARWTQEQRDFVDRNTGLTEWGPKMQEYIDAQDTLSQSGYWDIQDPLQAEKRRSLRRSNPEIDRILVKWYGYKQTGLRIPSLGRTRGTTSRSGLDIPSLK